MNKSQKQMLAIFIPIVVLVLTFGITNVSLDSEETAYYSGIPGTTIKGALYSEPVDVKAFDFDKTWWLWMLALVVIAGIEFKLFEDKK